MFNVADKSVPLVARWFVYVSVQYENTYIIACILIDTPRMLMNNCCHPPRRTMFYQFITQWNRHASSNCIDDLLLQDDTETLHLRGNANLCTLISSHSNMAPQKLTIHKTVVSMVSSCSFLMLNCLMSCADNQRLIGMVNPPQKTSRNNQSLVIARLLLKPKPRLPENFKSKDCLDPIYLWLTVGIHWLLKLLNIVLRCVNIYQHPLTINMQFTI